MILYRLVLVNLDILQYTLRYLKSASSHPHDLSLPRDRIAAYLPIGISRDLRRWHRLSRLYLACCNGSLTDLYQFELLTTASLLLEYEVIWGI